MIGLNTSLEEKIQSLINSRREGNNWDFKQEWHKNNADLLKDIISLANNPDDEEAYLIFGVEDGTFNIVGVCETDSYRKELSGLTQFVLSKPFAGDIPKIDLKRLKIEGHNIDVIIIRNSNNTPFFLKSDYTINGKSLKHSVIYTRVNDTTTGHDVAAPFSQIESLWKKRFGLSKTDLDRFMGLLDKPEDWSLTIDDETIAYYKTDASFSIVKDGDPTEGVEPYSLFYPDPTITVQKIKILKNSTPIYRLELLFVDGHRKWFPICKTTKPFSSEDFWYSYIELDTIEGKLLILFNSMTQAISSREWTLNQILLFKSKEERCDFETFLALNFQSISNEEILTRARFAENHPDVECNRAYTIKHVAKAGIIYEKWKNKA